MYFDTKMWVVGNSVVTAKGKCTVVFVGEGAVRLRDEAGGEFDLIMREPAPIAAERKTRRSSLSQPIDARMLSPAVVGFLLSRATLYAEVKVDRQERFVDKYKFSEGDDMGCFLLIQDKKWGNELRIRIRASKYEVEALGIADLLIDGGSGTFEINSNRLWWKLHGIGFKLGKSHDLQVIRGAMDDVAEFDRGCNVLPKST